MARSFRHLPICGFGHSEKFLKRKANRKLRRSVTVALVKNGEAMLPILRERSNIRDGAHDGCKGYLVTPLSLRDLKLLRK